MLGRFHTVPLLGCRMKLSTLKALLPGGRLRLLFDVQRLLSPTYRLAFLSAAATEGLLARLRGGPVPAQQLLAEPAPDPAVREGLAAWLAVGVRLGELSLDERGYGVRGRLARQLAEADHDAMAALVEETASLHYGMLRELPARAREARPMTLADQDWRLIARSSRVLEPILGEAVDDVVPAGGAVRLLEIGCGSGVYIRRADGLHLHLLDEIDCRLRLEPHQLGRTHRGILLDMSPGTVRRARWRTI